MNWKVVSASCIGTSHVVAGQQCQDSCWAQVDLTPAQLPVLSMFVADGAGSASHGGEGAELAIKAAADFLQTKLTLTEFGLNDELAVDCIMAIRECIYTRAAQDALKARDFACTFLGVISTEEATLLLQVGDGAIAIDFGNGLEVPVAPMAGEYANMTHFVTDEDAVDVLECKVYSAAAKKVAAFSDGIQRLALNLDANTAHEPFFRPLFKVLGETSAEREDELQQALVKFLNSDAVNERTDDDKTLALAVMCP